MAHVRRHGHRFQNPVHAVPETDGIGIGFEMDVRGVEAQGFLQNLVHKGRDGGFERRIGLLALHVKDDFLADLRPTAVFPQLLDRLGAQAEVLLNDGMDGAGGGEDNLEALAEEEAQIALLHLARRLAESQRQAVIFDAQREQMVVENELDRHQLQRFPLEVERDGIGEIRVVGRRQCAPSVFFGGEVQIHNGAMLRQAQPPLTAPALLKLRLSELALLEQEVPHFFRGAVRVCVH